MEKEWHYVPLNKRKNAQITEITLEIIRAGGKCKKKKKNLKLKKEPFSVHLEFH